MNNPQAPNPSDTVTLSYSDSDCKLTVHEFNMMVLAVTVAHFRVASAARRAHTPVNPVLESLAEKLGHFQYWVPGVTFKGVL